MCSCDLSSSLGTILNATLGFTVTRSIDSHALLRGPAPSNNGLVKHLLSLFIAKRDGKMVGGGGR